MIVPAPEGSRWGQELAVGKCGCVVNGVLEVNPERTVLLYWKPTGDCERHRAESHLEHMTAVLRKWSRTGLDGGKLTIMEGGSLQVEGPNVVARVPVVFSE